MNTNSNKNYESTNRIIYVANIYPKNGQVGALYSIDGICFTLTTGTHGYNMGNIIYYEYE